MNIKQHQGVGSVLGETEGRAGQDGRWVLVNMWFEFIELMPWIVKKITACSCTLSLIIHTSFDLHAGYFPIQFIFRKTSMSYILIQTSDCPWLLSASSSVVVCVPSAEKGGSGAKGLCVCLEQQEHHPSLIWSRAYLAVLLLPAAKTAPMPLQKV